MSLTWICDLAQCKNEGWADKLQEQADEGCSVSGRIRVNKVIGNIHLSPGRSFQSNSRNLYELVPYLRDDGNRHDFSHIIHHFAFEGEMNRPPLVTIPSERGSIVVRRRWIWLLESCCRPWNEKSSWPYCQSARWCQLPYFKGSIYVSVLPQGRIDAIQDNGWKNRTFSRHMESHPWGIDWGLSRSILISIVSLTLSVILRRVVWEKPLGVFMFIMVHKAFLAPSSTMKSHPFLSYTLIRDNLSLILSHRMSSILLPKCVMSTSSFIRTCAIVGGVLTVASLLDSVLFATSRALKKSGTGGFGSSSKLM